MRTKDKNYLSKSQKISKYDPSIVRTVRNLKENNEIYRNKPSTSTSQKHSQLFLINRPKYPLTANSREQELDLNYYSELALGLLNDGDIKSKWNEYKNCINDISISQKDFVNELFSQKGFVLKLEIEDKKYSGNGDITLLIKKEIIKLLNDKIIDYQFNKKFLNLNLNFEDYVEKVEKFKY